MANEDRFIQWYLWNGTNGHFHVDSVELESNGKFVPVGAWFNNTHGKGGNGRGIFPFDDVMKKRAEPLAAVDFAPEQEERFLVHVSLPDGVSAVQYTAIRIGFHNSYGTAGSTITEFDAGLVLDSASPEDREFCDI